MHHGIKGQEWGERNGPPYPLSKKDHMQVIASSKSEAKALNKKARDDRRIARANIKAVKRAKKAEIKRQKSEQKLAETQKKIEEERAKRDERFKNEKKATGIESLTNEELIQRTNRLKLEAEYKRQMESARGKKQGIIAGALRDAAQTALKTAATAALVFAGKQALAKALGAKPEWKGSGPDGKDDAKAMYKEIFGGGGGGGNKKKR